MAVTSVAAQPRSTTGVQRGDQIFKWILRLACFIAILTFIALVIALILGSTDSIQKFGLGFFTSSDWDPPNEIFGAGLFIFGTVVTSIIALVIATPLAIGAALFVSEYAPPWLGGPIGFMVELLVAIPSIVFGMWGLYQVAPVMKTTVEPFLQNTLGHVPIIGALFPRGALIGQDLLTAGVVLSIMIVPTIMSISREIISQVPRLQKEGMLALGATKWETLRMAVLPYARGGIIGAAILGLARALGETMAVTLVIGNSSSGKITPSLFQSGYTISSIIANEFVEADKGMHTNALIELGLVLLLVASVFNIVALIFVRRITRLPGAK